MTDSCKSRTIVALTTALSCGNPVRYDLRVGVLVESLLTAIGFVLLAYSLYATGLDASEPDDRRPS